MRRPFVLMISVTAGLCLMVGLSRGEEFHVTTAPELHAALASITNNPFKGEAIIKVAQGTYIGNFACSHGYRNIVLLGGYTHDFSGRVLDPSITVLEAASSGLPVVRLETSQGADVYIEGFTIKNGGRGIYIDSLSDENSGAWITISNNIITNNHTTGKGGGIGMRTGYHYLIWPPRVSISNNSITDNTASNGGGISIETMAVPYTDISIAGNEIRKNAASYFGGGIRIETESPVKSYIDANSITENEGIGAAIHFSQEDGSADITVNCDAIICNNVIADNYSYAGESGGILFGEPGNGLQLPGNELYFINNTITGNTYSGVQNNAFQIGASSAYFYNNILWGNEGADVYYNKSSEDYLNLVAYNNLFGSVLLGYPYAWSHAANNIYADPYAPNSPKFVNNIKYADKRQNPDFRLQPNSPCVDMGLNSAPQITSFDLLGNTRIVDGNGNLIPTVDMGAYEYAPGASPPSAPENPSPANFATNVSIETLLDWDDCIGATSYEVYLGTVFDPDTNPLPLVGTVTSSSYDPGELSLNKTYYWKVVAVNSYGSTPGPPDWYPWVFKTALVSKYYLDISADVGGTTTPLPGTYPYNSGTSVPVMAIPYPNYTFSYWSGAVPSGHETDNPVTLTINSDKSVTCHFSFQLSPASEHAVGDFDGDGAEEAAVDFGTLGIWLWDSGSWAQIRSDNPETMVALDINGNRRDEIAVDFGPAGLWLWEAGAWTQLDPADPERLIVADTDNNRVEELILDLGASGLKWRQENGYMCAMTSMDPINIIAADVDGDKGQEVVADFGSAGIWIWDLGSWSQITSAYSCSMLRTDLGGSGQDGISLGLISFGTWFWDNNNWTQLSGLMPENQTARKVASGGKDQVIGDFGSVGLWLLDGTVWNPLSGENAQQVISADVDGDSNDEIVVDFGTLGLWLWDTGVWSQLTGVNPENILSGDLDEDDRKELVADFGALGVWKWEEGNWSQLTGVNPD